MESVNKMGVKNLTVVFAPTLMKSPAGDAAGGFGACAAQFGCIQNFITHAKELFGERGKEMSDTQLALLEGMRRIEQAKVRHNTLLGMTRPTSQVLIH